MTQTDEQETQRGLDRDRDRDLLAVRAAQIDYLTARGAAGNVAGACSVPLLLLDTLTDTQTRQTAQRPAPVHA